MMRFRRKTKPTDPLDRPLFDWSRLDTFTVRDLLNGGVAITGRSGSGKTSSSGRILGNSIIRLAGSGGLILAAKPEDLGMWQGIFGAAGRSEDLIEFSPSADKRFNLLGYVLSMGGHTRDVVRCITSIGETLRTADTKGGESADFWERENERMIYNATEIVKIAQGSVSAPDIQMFINTAPMSPEMIKQEEWKAKFCNTCMRAAYDKTKTAVESHDYQLASNYWLLEFPSMGDKTRSSIMTGVLGILHVFNVGVVRELVSTTTNVSPDDIFKGKWVIVDMSPSEWGDMGLLVASGWKYLTEKAVLRRHADESSNVVTIWCDEAAQFINSFDSHFITQCRSHKGCLVFLTQSLHSYLAAMQGQGGEHKAYALLTNFATKIMHAIGDEKTAEWASSLLGKERQTFVGTSSPPVENILEELMGRSKVTTSSSEHYEYAIQPKEFMHGMRTGGLECGLICDGIVIKSGRPFSTGENWLMAPFPQR